MRMSEQPDTSTAAPWGVTLCARRGAGRTTTRLVFDTSTMANQGLNSTHAVSWGGCTMLGGCCLWQGLQER